MTMAARAGAGGRGSPMTARHLVIHGRVQGVFYRDWTVETARALGLSGWVRNLPDGTVEAHLEGDEEAIERMVAAMHGGSPRAHVDHIDATPVEPEAYAEFIRR